MTRRKARTSISIPKNLLADLDQKASEQGRTRSDLVCEAVSSYFAGEEERLLAEGYVEMNGASLRAAGEFLPDTIEIWPGRKAPN